jgi:hypothetical protein
MMKTSISGMIFGGLVALTLSACNTTPMNSDNAMGSSQAGMTQSSDGSKAMVNNASGKMPVNCATNTAVDGTNAANNPGAQCPTESH